MHCCMWCIRLIAQVHDKSSVQQTPQLSELSAKLEKVEELERQIEDQKFKISQLREEKVCLRRCVLCIIYDRLNL